MSVLWQWLCYLCLGEMCYVNFLGIIHTIIIATVFSWYNNQPIFVCILSFSLLWCKKFNLVRISTLLFEKSLSLLFSPVRCCRCARSFGDNFVDLLVRKLLSFGFIEAPRFLVYLHHQTSSLWFYFVLAVLFTIIIAVVSQFKWKKIEQQVGSGSLV